MSWLLNLISCVLLGATQAELPKVQWTGGSNIQWPCTTTRDVYKEGGKYINKNVIATRATIYKDDAFLALPRYRPGVPITLGKLSLKGKNPESSLTPFPCWSIQEEGNCAALQSVVDLFLDPQNILWVLDSGIINSLEEPIHQCPPKVVAINVKTGKLVKTVNVSPLTTPNSRLQYIVADYTKNGRVFIYISDAANRAILVFDVMSGRGYRVILPRAVTHGCSRRDVLYLTLIRQVDNNNSVVFTYLSSNHLFSIKSKYLQNGSAHGKINDIGPKKEKVVFLGTDNGSAIFFRKEGQPDVYRWDLHDRPTDENIRRVYEGNPGALPTQVMPDYKRGRMRILESNFPDYFHGTVGCGIVHALKVF